MGYRTPEYQQRIDDFNAAHPFELYIYLSGGQGKQFFGRFATRERADEIGAATVGTLITFRRGRTITCRRYSVVDTRPVATPLAA